MGAKRTPTFPGFVGALLLLPVVVVVLGIIAALMGR